jgi:hypothetical protein
MMNAEKASKAALRHPEASLRSKLRSRDGGLEQSKPKPLFGPSAAALGNIPH